MTGREDLYALIWLFMARLAERTHPAIIAERNYGKVLPMLNAAWDLITRE